MGVLYYKTAYGLFPFIVSDTIYSQISGLSGGTLYQNGNPTQLNSSIKQILSGQKLLLTGIIANGVPITPEVYNNASDIVGAIAITKVNPAIGQSSIPYEDHILSINKSTDFSVNIRYGAYITAADLRANDQRLLKNGSTVATTNFKPYCVFSSRTAGGSSSDDLKVFVMALNESLSSGTIISMDFFAGNYVDNSYAGIYPIPSNSISGIADLINSVKPIADIPDPYEDGGESTEDLGGDGTFDGTSDQIDDSTLPTISAANTGFTRIYNPTLAQVQALANYLWTDQTIIQTLWNHVKQFLENPMDAFIAFNLVPCSVPDGGTTEFKVMYIGTGVNMTAAASQFVDVDCGTLDIDEYYGSALDYAPNTKISVFLPFIGTVQLDTDDVMGKTIGIKYRIDIVSGGCVAKITVDGSIHYQYSGHCAINIPFTSADYTGYISAMLQAAKVGSTIASAGASAAAATAEEGVAIPEMAAAGATAAEMMEASRAYDRRIVGSGVEGATEAAFNSLAPKNISNTVGVVMSSKPVVERSGSFSGNTGYLGIRRPFCIIERPRMCNPSEYGKYNGRPAMITMSLGDCNGFTKVQQVQLTGIPATNPELDEIGAFLKGGVVL